MLVLMGVLTLVPGAPPEDAARADRDKLQGNWRMVSMEIDGIKAPDQVVKTFSLSFKDDKYTSLQADPAKLGAGARKTGSFTIDPSKDPRAMNILPADGEDKGKTWSLIYSLEGNTLRICGAEVGKDRPTAFESKPGTGIILMTLRHDP
jgi:uncharacterized protein (TIGR03067 family)